MANYYAKTRSNYFGVNSKEDLEKIINRCCSMDSNEVKIAESDGKYAILCESEIMGYETDYGYDFDKFIKDLSSVVEDGDAVILTEVGHEKMRYLSGSIVVITKNQVQYKTLQDIGISVAQEMLNNPNWETRNNY